jgi:hypothetical protein
VKCHSTRGLTRPGRASSVRSPLSRNPALERLDWQFNFSLSYAVNLYGDQVLPDAKDILGRVTRAATSLTVLKIRCQHLWRLAMRRLGVAPASARLAARIPRLVAGLRIGVKLRIYSGITILVLAGLLAAAQPLQAAALTNVVYGVLATNPSRFQADTQAGFRLSEIDINWATAEPTKNQFASSYLRAIEAQIAEYHAAGWGIAISPGFQTPPSWLTGLRDGRLVDQNGPTRYPNYEFSQAVQNATFAYVRRLVKALGPDVTQYRDGFSENGEMLFDDTSTNAWYVFDRAAECDDSTNLAVAHCDPMPGWIPGRGSYDGRRVTLKSATAFYDWYEGALQSLELTFIRTVRKAGFSGGFQLVMPGTGSGPTVLKDRLAARLAPGAFDSYSTMNTGANWQSLLSNPRLRKESGIVVDISSVGDGSGFPAPNNECAPGDSTLTLAQADPWISGWSDTRWITYLARRNGYAVIGENAGNSDLQDLPAILDLVQSCGLLALQWAWDGQLVQEGTASLPEIAANYAASTNGT